MPQLAPEHVQRAKADTSHLERLLLCDLAPTDGSNCRLGSGDFGTSPFSWQFLYQQNR
jgi:hypothetical protein